MVQSILDISPRVLEKIMYFANYIVIDPGDTPLMKKQILTEAEYRDMREKYDDFRAGMGASPSRSCSQSGISTSSPRKELTAELREASGQKRLRIIKRLEVVESFRLSHTARRDDHGRCSGHPAGNPPDGSWTAAASQRAT